MVGLSRTLCGVVLLGALASSAAASDWYVDAASGNNANSGNSPASPWQTITHAVANTPQTGLQTIHVAPGTYGAAIGEVFPWSWRPSLSLVGDQGSAVTLIINGGVGTPAITMESFYQSAGWVIGNDTLIQGLTFQGGTSAMTLSSNWNQVSPTLRNLAISGMSGPGIHVSAFTQFQGGAASPVLDNVAISNCGSGLSLSASGTSGFVVTATDCSFTGNAGAGINCVAYRTMQLSLERCRIENSGSWGLQCTGANYGYIQVAMHATLIAHNVGGIWGSTGALYFNSLITATQCTIADNGNVGVRIDHGNPSNSVAQLNSTIIHGHVDDLALIAGPLPYFSTIDFCEIGDGEFAGSQGNFQGDPLFVNAAAGDYHLLGGSPCIDTGDPTLPLESDCSRADVGAFPFVHPQSLVYCTAKLNSCNTLPAIAGSGTPSAAASSGYVVSATGAKALKAGLLLYSTTGRAALPFEGGFLCVAAPVRRSSTVIDTSGTPGLCNGVLSIDMNAFAAGSLGGNPSAALRVAGTQVNCQYWGRDTLTARLLSNAVEYFVCL